MRGETLADVSELEPPAPAVLQHRFHRAGFGPREPRIYIQPRERFFTRVEQQAGVAREIREAKVGESGLARSDQLAGPAELQVCFGDFESISLAFHDAEPLKRFAAAAVENQQAM